MTLFRLQMPKMLKGARSGSWFESRVERDRKEAEARRKQAEVLKQLQALERSNGEQFTERSEAEAELKRLWIENPQSVAGHNDLAVAFAWVEQWTQALDEIDKAIAQAADDKARKRAEANRDHIKSARDAAR